MFSITEIHFEKNPDEEIDLLIYVSNAMVDLSFQEMSIHYLKVSNVPVERPYKLLEDEACYETQKFYAKNYEIFKEFPQFFRQFLKNDRNSMRRILLDRSISFIDDITQ